MKVFLISMENQPERRKRLVQDLQKLDLEYEIFNAINGSALNENELNSLCDVNAINKHGSWFTKGVIGCSLSHYNVYKKIIEQNLPYALILEDDAKLPNNIKHILSNIEKKIHKDEVILLYRQTGGGVCKLSKKSKEKIDEKYSLYQPLFPTSLGSAVAYIVTNNACKILTNVILPIRNPSDHWSFFYEKGLKNIRIIHPRAIGTYDFRSSISNLSLLHKNSLRARIANIIDKGKIFPFYQILSLRRQYANNVRYNKFEFVNDEN